MMVMAVVSFPVVVVVGMSLELFRQILRLLGVMVSPQYQYRRAVNDEAEDSHENGLIERDLHRRDEAVHALPDHHDRESCEQHGPGIAAERVDLPCSEAEILVVSMPAGVDIGKGIDAQRSRVRGHVQAVRQQRHGSEDDPRGDLDHHHGRGNRDHDEGARFSRSLQMLAERVRMLPEMDVVFVHSGKCPRPGAPYQY